MLYQNRKTLHHSLLTLPALLIYTGFVVIPIIGVFYYSLLDWDGFSPIRSFIGLDNFVQMWGDDRFTGSLLTSFVHTLFTVLLSNVLGITLAAVLDGRDILRRVLRTIYFIPLLLSPVAAAYILRTILGFRGILNQLLTSMELAPQNLLGNPDIAIFGIVIFAVWQSTGLTFVIYLSAMQAIPKELYDAAGIDGAGFVRRFIHVTFPWLAPAVTTATVSMFTFTMREYARPAILTNGGPVNSTETIAFQIVRVGFNENNLSYASAQAVIMLVVVGLIAAALVTVLRKREEFLS